MRRRRLIRAVVSAAEEQTEGRIAALLRSNQLPAEAGAALRRQPLRERAKQVRITSELLQRLRGDDVGP